FHVTGVQTCALPISCGRPCGPSTTVPSARSASVPVTAWSPTVYSYATVNVVSAGTVPFASPVTTLWTENPPAATSAVFVSVTSVFSPSPTVTDCGLNSAAPHATPGTVGRTVSANVTTVPTARFCGPSTTVPSAVTTSVPVVGTPSSS